ncbi:MAG: CPBP family intramembrane metalloprotease [Clostridia bacterium]|nr:CPBP family intramembrane metalloprotease [Clostridia bacterium]
MKLNRKASILFLISLGLYLALSVVLLLLQPKSTETAFLLNAFMISLPAFLIPAIIFRRRNRFPISPAPLFGHILLALLLGVGCVLMNEALSSLNSALFFGIDISSNSTTAEDILSMSTWSMILSLAIIPPLSEEFLMRGALLEAWRRYSPIGAAFLTSLLFALLHCAPSAFMIYFGIGLLLAAIYLITRNVWLTVIVHFVNNFASVIAALSLRSQIGADGSASELISESESVFGALNGTRMGYIGWFIIYGVIAALFLVPCMMGLVKSCRRRGIGMFAPETEAAPGEGEATLTDAILNEQETVPEEKGSMWSDGVLWGVIIVLLVLNIVSGLYEFGVIKFDL